MGIKHTHSHTHTPSFVSVPSPNRKLCRPEGVNIQNSLIIQSIHLHSVNWLWISDFRKKEREKVSWGTKNAVNSTSHFKQQLPHTSPLTRYNYIYGSSTYTDGWHITGKTNIKCLKTSSLHFGTDATSLWNCTRAINNTFPKDIPWVCATMVVESAV